MCMAFFAAEAVGAMALGQQAAAAVPGANPDIALDSVWDFVVRGGPTIVAIGVCSLIALTVIVERLILLRRGSVLPRRFLTSLQAVASDRDKALQLCESDGSPVASVLREVIKHRGQSPEAVEQAVRSAGSRVIVRLRHRLRLLSALPQVSTMLGLLGTIFGMIKTFQAVAVSGQALGKTEMLARGIFEAWTSTAAGLLVAIPVLIVYHVLMGRVDAVAMELDRVASEWLEGDAGFMTSPQAQSPEPVVALRSAQIPAPIPGIAAVAAG